MNLFVVGIAIVFVSGMNPTHARDEATARRSINKSLPFLETQGVAWMQQRGCVTCHHTPFLLWTHSEAHRRGFQIDRRKLEEWTNWTLLNVVANLDAEPDNEADTLSQLLLARDSLSPWFAKPKLWHSRPADPYENLTRHLLKAQAAEGSWVAGGQSSNPKELPTAWALLALSSRDAFMKAKFAKPEKASTFHNMVVANDKAIPIAREKALKCLQQQDAGKTMHLTEGLITRFMLERQLGNNAKADEFEQLLLSRQNADGGWSANLNQKQPSDAFATGQSLYALNLAGRNEKEKTEAISRAVAFLVKSQQADGSWKVASTSFVPSKGNHEREKETDAVYSYWGTAWATLGLLHTLPVQKKK